jgi:hypothetical protein
MLSRVLDRKPEVEVPAPFAARVAAALPPLPARRRQLPLGRLAAAGSALAATLVLFVLAGKAHPELHNFAFDMELLMLIELCGIGWYFGLRREM